MCNVKTVLQMKSDEAKSFFLKEESYCNLDMPPYYYFSEVLECADDILISKKGNRQELQNIWNKDVKPSNIEKINYTVNINKQGRYSWREITLINPLLYVYLVNLVTEKNNWEMLIKRINKLKSNSIVDCVSMPLESHSNKGDKAETINNWWEYFEQQQIRKNLEYDYCGTADISNCYPSIYTHSIAWAVMGKKKAKINRHDKKELGNKIDFAIQSMQHGQTNGIPQGSVLMDFIAEILLHYIDELLSEKLAKADINHLDFSILRYRDDYRIFSNEKNVVEEITKILSLVLSELKLSLNDGKTTLLKDSLIESIKPEKLYWNSIYSSMKNKNHEIKVGLQKHLFEIAVLSRKHPDTGQVNRALVDFYKYRLIKIKRLPSDYEQLISIATYILLKSPSSVSTYRAIIGKLLSLMSKDEAKKIARNVAKKLNRHPNTEHLEIWLYGLTSNVGVFEPYDKIEKLPKILQMIENDNINKVWNFDWVQSRYRQRIENAKIFDFEKFKNDSLVMQLSDFDLFFEEYN